MLVAYSHCQSELDINDLLSRDNNRNEESEFSNLVSFEMKDVAYFLGHSLSCLCVWRSPFLITHWNPGNVIDHLRANLKAPSVSVLLNASAKYNHLNQILSV